MDHDRLCRTGGRPTKANRKNENYELVVRSFVHQQSPTKGSSVEFEGRRLVENSGLLGRRPTPPTTLFGRSIDVDKETCRIETELLLSDTAEPRNLLSGDQS